MLILQSGFWTKTYKYETAGKTLTNKRFQCMENTYRLRLTAKQNGSRNL